MDILFTVFTITVLIVTIIFYNKRRLQWMYIMVKNLPKDMRTTHTLLKIHRLSKKCLRERLTVHGQFNSLVERHPQKIALYFEDQMWTYAQINAYANRITNYFQSQGLQKGDCVAFIYDNSPQYMAIILGLVRLGVVTALINTNLVKDSLIYSITVVKAKAIIFSSSYQTSIHEIINNLKDIRLYQMYESPTEKNNLLNSVNLNVELEKVNDINVNGRLPQISPDDSAIYIYTSGTTGLPKASIITHTRFLIASLGVSLLVNANQDDIIYSPLPLYHAGGCIAGAGQSILGGVTTVIKKRFSATNYFKDCEKYKVTIAQYIGEMCRYVLVAHEQKEAANHQIRTMFGNGFNPVVWKKFVERFNIKNVVELYGSTEGIALLVNVSNVTGSVGYIPLLIRLLDMMVLVKCDEMGDPIRDSNGFCIKCKANEPGLILGKINSEHAVFTFKGYTDDTASKNKIWQDVFSKGDMFFNSGDMLSFDNEGDFYFIDRMGDTFRWKGENVSTVEVELVINRLVNLREVIVYGVQIPNTEGRVGMAAIVDPNKTINIEALGNALQSNLPSYSIPLFIRMLDTPRLTSTFKLQKFELREESYNINVITDRMYFFDASVKKYVSFTEQLYNDVINCKMRL